MSTRKIFKEIWTGDRVKVVTGRYIGKQGIVTKREPRFAHLVRFVWVRFDEMKGGVAGPRIHVKNVQVTEMDRGHRAARRARQRASCRQEKETARREDEPDTSLLDHDD